MKSISIFTVLILTCHITFGQSEKETKKIVEEILAVTVQVLAIDAALIGFTAIAELITIDDKVLDIGTGAYTYVWKKIDGQWKIVHIHESAK